MAPPVPAAAVRAVRIASICTDAEGAAGAPGTGGGTGSRAIPTRIHSSTPVTTATSSAAPAIIQFEIGGEGSTRSSGSCDDPDRDGSSSLAGPAPRKVIAHLRANGEGKSLEGDPLG